EAPVALLAWMWVTMWLRRADRGEIVTGGAAGANPPVPVAGAVAEAAGASPMVANDAAASASAPLPSTLMSPPLPTTRRAMTGLTRKCVHDAQVSTGRQYPGDLRATRRPGSDGRERAGVAA